MCTAEVLLLRARRRQRRADLLGAACGGRPRDAPHESPPLRRHATAVAGAEQWESSVQVERAIERTLVNIEHLEGSFPAVPTPIFAGNFSFCSISKSLHDLRTFAALFRNNCQPFRQHVGEHLPTLPDVAKFRPRPGKKLADLFC